MPTEPVEHRAPTTLEELELMSTERLERIVAEGGAKRLQRPESEADERGDVVADD